MPYTPPSQQSPAVSKLSSPAQSRPQSSTNLQSSLPRSPGMNPDLPRSTSSTAYLQKSRRSPSFRANGLITTRDQSPKGASNAYEADRSSMDKVLHQSAPLMTNEANPPASFLSASNPAQNLGDDEERSAEERGQEENIMELRDAVARFLLGTNGNPSEKDKGLARKIAAFPDFSSPDFVEQLKNLKAEVPGSRNGNSQAPPHLSATARKISHSRSATDSSISFPPAQMSTSSDESEDDMEDMSFKPSLLRKKSGELVKPAIRPHPRRKHSSMPGTPTFSKAVHFNENIQQVRHFSQVDRPIAVSAGASPVENYDDEHEFPFDFATGSTSNLEIRLGNFPRASFERQSMPIRVERISLSNDQKSLIGSVAVANLSFHKLVVARFTLDYWKTTSEVVAEYSTDVRRKQREDGYDQFNFSIKLSDQVNLESKTMLICVRYNVNGQEFWDNNNSMNFQVQFTKTAKSSALRADTQPVGSRPIPRSRHNSSSSGKPRSVLSFDDDFADNFDGGSTTFRFTNSSSAKPVTGDTPPQRSNPAGQPFGSRYDFGASLTAALSHAQTTLGERVGIKKIQEKTTSNVMRDAGNNSMLATPGSASLDRSAHIAPAIPGTESPSPATLIATSQSVDSRAYQEFVSKFCFVCSSAVYHRGASFTDRSHSLEPRNLLRSN